MLGVGGGGRPGLLVPRWRVNTKARAVYVAVSCHGNTPIAYNEITNTPVSFKHFYEYYMVIL